MDVVGEVVQRVDRCAVEVLDCGEVDGKPWPPEAASVVAVVSAWLKLSMLLRSISPLR